MVSLMFNIDYNKNLRVPYSQSPPFKISQRCTYAKQLLTNGDKKNGVDLDYWLKRRTKRTKTRCA